MNPILKALMIKRLSFYLEKTSQKYSKEKFI